MSERIVIVGYKPHVGKEDRLVELLRSHVHKLQAEGLATDREPIIAKASDGSFVEVFGWKSVDAITAAHSNAEVQKMWSEFAEVCDYVPVGSLPETKNLFSEFSSL
ncbi:MAG: hypothetical protein RIC35_17775 [Marinoscillum sp.]